MNIYKIFSNPFINFIVDFTITFNIKNDLEITSSINLS